MVSGHLKSIGIPRVDWLSMGPLDLGHHSLVSELKLTIREFGGYAILTEQSD